MCVFPLPLRAPCNFQYSLRAITRIKRMRSSKSSFVARSFASLLGSLSGIASPHHLSANPPCPYNRITMLDSVLSTWPPSSRSVLNHESRPSGLLTVCGGRPSLSQRSFPRWCSSFQVHTRPIIRGPPFILLKQCCENLLLPNLMITNQIYSWALRSSGHLSMVFVLLCL